MFRLFHVAQSGATTQQCLFNIATCHESMIDLFEYLRGSYTALYVGVNREEGTVSNQIVKKSDKEQK